MKQSALLTYFKESYQEFKRVTWPTNRQAIRLCGIVLAFVLVSAVIIAGLDYVFSLGYQFLITLRK